MKFEYYNFSPTFSEPVVASPVNESDKQICFAAPLKPDENEAVSFQHWSALFSWLHLFFATDNYCQLIICTSQHLCVIRFCLHCIYSSYFRSLSVCKYPKRNGGYKNVLSFIIKCSGCEPDDSVFAIVQRWMNCDRCLYGLCSYRFG